MHVRDVPRQPFDFALRDPLMAGHECPEPSRRACPV